MSAQVTAVGYTRRSTDKQETSIAEQTKAIQQYADEHGFKILRWYTDDAISGDDTKRRVGFLQMLADAQQRSDFETIVCWDQSRFGRFSPQEAGHWTYLFSEANVGLVTVDKGSIDWTDFTGWLTYSVNQNSKHDFLKQLSKDVVRGFRETAVENAGWLGSPPYGYRIEGAKKKKRLVVDDVVKVKVVQRIFREFVEEGRSMRNIAERLRNEKFPSPGGREKSWRFDAVRVILENPAYCGDYASGRYTYGVYASMQAGKKVDRKGARIKNPESQWIVRRDTHEAIIDRDTFERARSILAKGKTGRSTQYKPEENPFALSGLLRCGKCGCPMWGDKSGVTRIYQCGNWQYGGVSACEGTKVHEDKILNGVAEHLENWLGFDDEREGSLDMAAVHRTLKPSDLPEAFEKVQKLVMPPAAPKQDRERLTKRAAKLTDDLAKARGNLVLLDAVNIPAAQDRIKQLAAELATIEEDLKRSKPPAEKDVNSVTLEVLRTLYSLAHACRELTRPAGKKRRRTAEEPVVPREVRRYFSHTSHIICHTTKTGTGPGTRYAFEKGEIVFRGVGGVTGAVSLPLR